MRTKYLLKSQNRFMRSSNQYPFLISWGPLDSKTTLRFKNQTYANNFLNLKTIAPLLKNTKVEVVLMSI